jgi:hypothetical protein
VAAGAYCVSRLWRLRHLAISLVPDENPVPGDVVERVVICDPGNVKLSGEPRKRGRVESVGFPIHGSRSSAGTGCLAR